MVNWRTIKSKVFIGSSSNSLNIANEIRTQLSGIADVTVWNDSGFFNISHGTFESLTTKVSDFDYAVLVGTPDDIVERARSKRPWYRRKERHASIRDNVLLEFGLFTGALGRDRVFLVQESNPGLKTASDLLGVTYLPFQTSGKLHDQMLSVCSGIRAQIEHLGVRDTRLLAGTEYHKLRLFDIFGIDADIDGGLHLVYGDLILSPIVSQALAPRGYPAPYFYSHKSNSNMLFSIETPISGAEVRGINYIARTIGNRSGKSCQIDSDSNLSTILDQSFISFGMPASNMKSLDLANEAKSMVDFGQKGIQIFETGTWISLPIPHSSQPHLGIVVKVSPANFPNRVWITCAGYGEWGTSGASWYLSQNFKQISDQVERDSFIAVTETAAGKDQSTKLVKLIRY